MKNLLIYLGFFLFLGSAYAQVKEVKTGEVAHDTLYNKYYITNLKANSIASDYGPSYYKDNSLIFSSAQKHKDNSGKKWKATGQRYLNFYTGVIDSIGNVVEIQGLSDTANSPYHESNAVFTKNGKRVFFTRNNYYHHKKNVFRTDKGRIMKIALFIADVDANGNFQNIVPFPYNSNEYSTGHPTLSPDEKTLFFTSDMPGSVGKTDIFKVDIKDNGTFSVPVNIGGNINTKGREMFPYIANDGTLYFSSDYHDGFGKLDIFKTDSNELELAAIQNLGKPFNSSRDDFSFIIDKENNSGYFSSNRTGGKGDDDVYHFYNEYTLQARKNIATKKADELIAKLPPKVDAKVIVNVINKKNKQHIKDALVKVTDEKTGEVIKEMKVNEDGSISFVVKENKRYKIEAIKPLFKNDITYVTTTDSLDDIMHASLALMPETRLNEKNEIIVDLNPIYFDFDSSKITKVSAEELNKVIDMMKKYPTMIIEGTSHTDARGGAAYNKKLSERRAQSTVDYVVNTGGINSGLIFANGYGETQITNRCVNGVRCKDSEHAMNRRTEFIIINAKEFQ